MCVCLSLYVHCPPSSCSNLSHLFCKLEQTSSRPLKFNKPFDHKAHNIPILPLRKNVRGRSASTHSAPTHPSDTRLLPPTKHNCSKEREKKNPLLQFVLFKLHWRGVESTATIRIGDSVLLPATLLDLRKQNTLVTTYLPTSSAPKNSTNSTFTSQSQKQNCSENYTRWCREQTSRLTKKNTQKKTKKHTHTHTHTHTTTAGNNTLKLVCTKPPVDTLQRKFSSELYLEHLFYLLLLLLLVPALQWFAKSSSPVHLLIRKKQPNPFFLFPILDAQWFWTQTWNQATTSSGYSAETEEAKTRSRRNVCVGTTVSDTYQKEWRPVCWLCSHNFKYPVSGSNPSNSPNPPYPTPPPRLPLVRNSGVCKKTETRCILYERYVFLLRISVQVKGCVIWQN